MQKIKQNLFVGLHGPLCLCDREEVIRFCMAHEYHDIALLISVESGV